MVISGYYINDYNGYSINGYWILDITFSYHPITFNYHILETFVFKNMGNWKMKTLIHLICNVRPKYSSSCFCELNSNWHIFPIIELWN
jgi:hypothetical protein